MGEKLISNQELSVKSDDGDFRNLAGRRTFKPSGNPEEDLRRFAGRQITEKAVNNAFGITATEFYFPDVKISSDVPDNIVRVPPTEVERVRNLIQQLSAQGLSNKEILKRCNDLTWNI